MYDITARNMGTPTLYMILRLGMRVPLSYVWYYSYEYGYTCYSIYYIMAMNVDISILYKVL